MDDASLDGVASVVASELGSFGTGLNSSEGTGTDDDALLDERLGVVSLELGSIRTG